MARIPGTTCGWETGDKAEIGTLISPGVIAATTTSPTPASGTYCLRCTSTNSLEYINIVFPSLLAEGWWKLRFQSSSPPGVVANWHILTFLDNVGNPQASVNYNTIDLFVRAYRADAVLLGVSSAVLSLNAWNLLDVHFKRHASAGIMEIWLNDTQILNLTGQNTGTADIQSFRIGVSDSGITGVSFFHAYDDLGVNDLTGSINNGRIGSSRVVYLPANGAGSNTNLSRGGTDTGANWSQVSPVPTATTSYVFSSTPTTRDTYALADLPVNAVSINCVEEIVQAENSDAGTGGIGLTTKSGATTTEAATQNLSTSWAYCRNLLETDPHTSAAWTVANVNALEAGVTVE